MLRNAADTYGNNLYRDEKRTESTRSLPSNSPVSCNNLYRDEKRTESRNPTPTRWLNLVTTYTAMKSGLKVLEEGEHSTNHV